MKQRDKIALSEWEVYRKNLIKETPVPNESSKEKADRIKHLEANQFKWYKYYFPQYCDADFANFQKRASKRIVKNDVIYIVKPWAREHAKSATSMMDEIFLMMTGEMKNMLIVSHSFDNAVDLIAPNVINLESNQRLINDYGVQKSTFTWDFSKGKWITANGCSIRAIGLKQSPRGTRNEEKRPDYIRVDDGDNDEMCRNPKRVEDAWNWVEQALFPCLSISGSKRMVFVGNIIAKDSIITRAMEVADYAEVVNILDKNGQPSWKERYTLEMVNYMLSKISFFSAQKEYFNNPVIAGQVFKDIYWKKFPKLSKYKFLLVYIDPSFKHTKKNDYKAYPLLGKFKNEFHVIKAFCEQCTTMVLAKACIETYKFVNDMVPVYFYIEANANQDDILKKTNKHLADLDAGFRLTGDYDKKGEKFARIEATLEPLNSNGELWFNEDEKNNPHMKRATEQLQAIEPSLSAPDDFPDSLQGAVRKYQQKTVALTPVKTGKRKRNNKRY